MNNMVIFKDPNLPKEVRASYLKDTEQLMKIVKDNKKGIVSSSIDKTKDMILNVIAPTRIINMLVTGKLDNDYLQMVNEAESLINNKLFYYSSKLQSYLD
jgi:hypothetical protein